MTEKDLLRLQRLREQTKSGDAKRIRETARISQSELGSAIELPASTVSYWEKGVRVPRGKGALRYAELLDKLEAASGSDIATAVTP